MSSSSSSRLNNASLGILNVITLLMSIPILLAGCLLSSDPELTECERFFYKPLIFVAIFIILVSLTGSIGAFFRIPGLLWIYLVFMFLIILGGVIFTLFAFLVTNKGAGEFLPGKGYKEYKLEDYSNWVQNRVKNTKNWNKIKSCLVESKICADFSYRFQNHTIDKLEKEPLNAIQSGCCKPSDDCRFTYWYPTIWTDQENGSVYKNGDCKAWNNDEKVLCYDCKSCKAAVIDTIQSSWKKTSFLNVICLVALILVYSVGCCAFRNTMIDIDHGGYYRRGFN